MCRTPKGLGMGFASVYISFFLPLSSSISILSCLKAMAMFYIVCLLKLKFLSAFTWLATNNDGRSYKSISHLYSYIRIHISICLVMVMMFAFLWISLLWITACLPARSWAFLLRVNTKIDFLFFYYFCIIFLLLLHSIFFVCCWNRCYCCILFIQAEEIILA